MNTGELLERLRRHYIKPGEGFVGGAFLPEVGWNGHTGGRCDALYVGFTSTSGRRLIGHELKVSRADWRHELDQPGKADGWADECHAWFVVAPSEDVVPREEVPAGWGLMVPNTRTKVRMQVLVRPEFHERTPSWAAARSLISRMDTLHRQQLMGITAEVRERERRVEAREEAAQHRATGALDRETQDRLEVMKRLEAALDVELHSWRGDDRVTPEELAAALKLVKAAGRMSPASSMWAANSVEQSARLMLETLEEFRAAATLLQRLAGARP